MACRVRRLVRVPRAPQKVLRPRSISRISSSTLNRSQTLTFKSCLAVSALTRHSYSMNRQASSDQKPDLQAMLRRLFFKIHPDLFHSFETERAANERSFKELNNFIDIVTTGKHHTEKSLSLTFFLKSVNLNPEDGEDSGTVTFRKVVSELSYTRNRQVFKSQMSKLFLSCEVHGDFVVNGGSFQDESSRPSGGRSTQQSERQAYGTPDTPFPESELQDFLARNLPESQSRLAFRQKESMLRASLNIQFRVSPTIPTWVPITSTVSTLDAYHEMLERLVGNPLIKQLQSHPPRFGSRNHTQEGIGIELAIADGSLPRDDTIAEWLDLLVSVPEDQWRSRKEVSVERGRTAKLFEDQIVQRTGIGSIFRDVSVHPDDYFKFLKDTMDHLSSDEKVMAVAETMSHKLSTESIIVMVTWLDPESGRKISLDQELGTVRVAFESAPIDMLNFADAHSRDIKNIVQHHEEKEARIDSLFAYTRRKLQIRGLDFDPALSEADIVRCCQKLQQHSRALVPFTSGQFLKIGEDYRLLDNGVMQIPWNFEL